MTSEPVTRTEWAVRYLSPPTVALAERACSDREQAERITAYEERMGSRCVVVCREVTYGEWTEAE